MREPSPRGIAVFDIGTTNTKIILFSQDGQVVASEAIKSERLSAPPYLAVDPEPVFRFAADVLPRLDKTLPIDVIVVSAHGSALALLNDEHDLALPMMDYLCEPPAEIVDNYGKIAPPFNEVFAPTLPGALTLGLQLFWQQSVFTKAFSTVKTIVPWGQYAAFRLGGKLVTELTALGAQTHLWDYSRSKFSSMATGQNWAQRFAPFARAYKDIGTLTSDFRGPEFRGTGIICAGVHDSDANYLRYLAGIKGDFTLLSTGTWIIGYDTRADINSSDAARDTVANLDIFGRSVAVCRFFGGQEFDILTEGHPTSVPSITIAQGLIDKGIFALPSFTDSGGPMPGTGNKGRIVGGTLNSGAEKASLASLYCALMVSESLDAIGSVSDIIVDGPFSTNDLFLSLLAQLRTGQNVKASTLRDGTTDGARLVGLMGEDGNIPSTHIELIACQPAGMSGLDTYQAKWREFSGGI